MSWLDTVDRNNPAAGIELLAEVKVGSLPDAVSFTPDCSTILVANEGEAGVDENGNFTNPEGSVTVVPVGPIVSGSSAEEIQSLVNTVGFTFMNDDPEGFTKEGVRWIWRGQGLASGKRGQTISKDMEPEQIVVTKVGWRFFQCFAICFRGLVLH